MNAVVVGAFACDGDRERHLDSQGESAKRVKHEDLTVVIFISKIGLDIIIWQSAGRSLSRSIRTISLVNLDARIQAVCKPQITGGLIGANREDLPARVRSMQENLEGHRPGSIQQIVAGDAFKRNRFSRQQSDATLAEY